MTRPRWVGWSPLVSVSIMMLSELRRSARNVAAREKEKKEREGGAVSDNDAEDAFEDSDGPGSNPGRAHGSSGVHKNPDNESSAKKPSGADGTRGSRSADRSVASRHASDDESRSSRCRAQQQWEACEGQAVRAVQWMRAATREELSRMPRKRSTEREDERRSSVSLALGWL